MLKRALTLGAAVAVIVGLSYLPAASASRPHAASWSAGDATGVRTTTQAVAKPGLRAGQKLTAPRFAKRVLRYQWLRCGVTGKACRAIRGATHRTYIVRSADVGHRLRVRAVLQGDTVATAAPTAVVGLPLPVNTAIPTITDGGQGGGTLAGPVVGDILSGSNGTWTNAVRFTYQWEDCDAAGASCAAIAGATSQTYTIASSDVGHTIVFQVTAYNF